MVSATFRAQWTCILTCILLLAGCTNKQPGGATANQTESITVPLEISPRSGLITLKASVNGEPVTMCLDTGANITCFDTRLLDRLKLEVKDSGLDKNITGNLVIKIAQVKEFRVGSFPYCLLKANFIDLHSPNEGRTALQDPTVDGLLGMDFLAKWNAVIDCRNKTMVVRNPRMLSQGDAAQ